MQTVRTISSKTQPSTPEEKHKVVQCKQPRSKGGKPPSPSQPRPRRVTSPATPIAPKAAAPGTSSAKLPTLLPFPRSSHPSLPNPNNVFVQPLPLLLPTQPHIHQRAQRNPPAHPNVDLRTQRRSRGSEEIHAFGPAVTDRGRSRRRVCGGGGASVRSGQSPVADSGEGGVHERD